MKNHKHTTEEFVALATVVHNSKFDYRHTVYINSRTKVAILCPEHGEFYQSPANHLHGRGCRKCRSFAKSSKPRTTSQFIAEAQVVHGAYYKYYNTMYKNAATKITITCPKHGDFDQNPGNHLRGSGCSKCGKKKMAARQRDSMESFIEKAREVHGERYQYLHPYNTARTPTTITCPDHGGFEQLPTNHLKGSGCPSCNGGVFSPSRPTILYYLSINDGTAYKIGITAKTVAARFTPADNLKIEVVKTWHFDNGRTAYETEQMFIKRFSDYRYQGDNLLGSGNTELFTTDVYEQLEQVVKEVLDQKI